MSQPDAESQIPLEEDIDLNEVELAWSKEIERRVKEVREGKVTPVSKEEFLRRLRNA